MSASSTKATGWSDRKRLVALLAVYTVCIGAALLFIGAYTLRFGFGTLTGADVGGPFRLIDGHAQVVTDRSWPGKYKLIYFGYTSCPDTCPTTLNTIADVLKRLGGKADELQPLFITVDPNNDTPSVMAAYTALFSPKIVGLTGTQRDIWAVMAEYGARAVRENAPGDVPLLEHTHALYVMAPDGRFIATLDPGLGADAMTAELRHDMRPQLVSVPSTGRS